MAPTMKPPKKHMFRRELTTLELNDPYDHFMNTNNVHFDNE